MPARARSRALQRELGVSGALAQVLVRRGLARARRGARAFLAGERGASARAPSRASTRRSRRSCATCASGGRITVHGDYDVDGVCSTAVLVRALRELGADVDWLPAGPRGRRLRAERGHRASGSRRAGTRLLITVDCAITAVEEVAAARALGMEVVVTDHHAPRADGVLPRAPIVHPALCGYPCRGAVRHRGRLQARAGAR